MEKRGFKENRPKNRAVIKHGISHTERGYEKAFDANLPNEERVVVRETGSRVPRGIGASRIVVGTDAATDGTRPCATQKLGIRTRTLAVYAGIVPRTETATVVVRNGSSNGNAVEVGGRGSSGSIQIQVRIWLYDRFARVWRRRNGG